MKPIDLFNVNATADATLSTSNVVDPNLFRPNPKKCADQIYRAIIRFLPNPLNPVTESIVGRYTTFIKNVKNNQRRKVEVIQGDGITDTFFNLNKSTLKVLQDRAQYFSRRETYYSLIEVVEPDPSQPEYAGKILVWEYGRKVKAMIDKQTHPDNPQMDIPKNPFNMLEGRCMALNISLNGVYHNYDNCKFYDVQDDRYCVQVPIVSADGQTTQYIPVNAQNSQNPQVIEAVNNWLANGPSLENYKASTIGHSDEEKQFIFEAIQAALDPSESPIPVAQGAFSGAPVNNNPLPTANQVMGGNAPQNPTNMMNPFGAQPTAQPQQGLNSAINPFGAPTSAPQSAPVTPGFNDSNVPSGLDSLINSQPSAQPAQPQQSSSNGGIQLTDVLGDIM